VKRAGETMRDLEWMEVCEQRGYIRGGEIREYQVTVKLWFKLEDGSGQGSTDGGQGQRAGGQGGLGGEL
jgi:hypothetical protein